MHFSRSAHPPDYSYRDKANRSEKLQDDGEMFGRRKYNSEMPEDKQFCRTDDTFADAMSCNNANLCKMLIGTQNAENMVRKETRDANITDIDTEIEEITGKVGKWMAST